MRIKYAKGVPSWGGVLLMGRKQPSTQHLRRETGEQGETKAHKKTFGTETIYKNGGEERRDDVTKKKSSQRTPYLKRAWGEKGGLNHRGSQVALLTGSREESGEGKKKGKF